MKTVAQVIAQLQKLDPTLPVLLHDSTIGFSEIEEIESESFVASDYKKTSEEDFIPDGTYAIIR